MFYHGIKFRLRPLNNTIDSKMVFSSKRREEAELKTVSHYLADGGVFVDIGANIGYYALNAALLPEEMNLPVNHDHLLIARLSIRYGKQHLDHVVGLVWGSLA